MSSPAVISGNSSFQKWGLGFHGVCEIGYCTEGLVLNNRIALRKHAADVSRLASELVLVASSGAVPSAELGEKVQQLVKSSQMLQTYTSLLAQSEKMLKGRVLTDEELEKAASERIDFHLLIASMTKHKEIA